MKKGILAIFAAFILVSIVFVGPVQASSQSLLKRMTDTANSLAVDEDFLKLLDADEFNELKSFIDVEVKDEAFIQQVEQLLTNIMEKQEYKNLIEKYETDLEYIYQKIGEKANDKNPDVTDNVYYSIFENDGIINIKKENQINEDNEELVIKSSDASIYINDLGWLPGSILQKVLNFFIFLRDIFTILAAIPLVIVYVITSILNILDYFGVEIEDVTIATISKILFFTTVVAAVFMIPLNITIIICSILEWFISTINNAKTKNRQESKIQRFNLFIQRLFNGLQRCFAKLQIQTTNSI